MITATKFSFSHPDKDLLHAVNFSIERGQSIALIGSCGSGKSSLANVLRNPDDFTYGGTLLVEPNMHIGFVSQFYDIDATATMSVYDYIAADFVAMQAKIDHICEQMATADDIEPLMVQYEAAYDAFQRVDGDLYESNIMRQLNLANLTERKDLEITKLSGGEFKLIQVIKQLLACPQLMIMDEPDAFLDFDNLKALKSLINAHKGALLVITHSRYLLNHCFNKIIHIENCDLQEFDGNYIQYNLALLNRKAELLEQSFEDELEIARNEKIIDRLRFIAEIYDDAGNGRALKARVKYQERLEQRRIKPPFLCIDKPNLHLNTPNPSQQEAILSVNHYTLAFDSVLLDDISFALAPTDKVAIIGANGTGKTSLMREICKNVNPNIHIAEDATVSYVSQNQGDVLNPEHTVFDAFFEIGFTHYDDISAYLEQFGFPREHMDLHIGTLSGGEKNILALAKIAHGESNLLILDEPTSHLDTYAQIALEEAVNAYNGAVLMISHDFYAVVNCCDYVLLIEDKGIRKVQMKKFKRKIYAEHFHRDYLELEQNKKMLETKIEASLHVNNFELAKTLLLQLEQVVAKM